MGCIGSLAKSGTEDTTATAFTTEFAENRKQLTATSFSLTKAHEDHLSRSVVDIVAKLDVEINGDAAGDNFGISVSNTSDINGDRYANQNDAVVCQLGEELVFVYITTDIEEI
ncbi:MAG: hypothetical protein V3V10_09495 [Planctomycetota bacterium]